MDGAALRIATRSSPLALVQAGLVADELRARHPGLIVDLVSVVTEGDRRLEVPLAELGGKGVFANEVQAAVLDGRAEVAVHSAKDLPARTPDGLRIAAVPRRADPRDALVGGRLHELPTGATVATGSGRRRAQLAHLRGDLRFVDLRGNMARRLGQVGVDGIDAVVVAVAALDRLGWSDRVAPGSASEVFPADQVVPQVAQGALAIECRVDDDRSAALLESIQDPGSRRCVDAERAFLRTLGGDCDLPAGAHVVVDAGGELHLRAVLAPASWPEHPAPLAHVERRGVDPEVVGTSAAHDVLAAVERLGPP
ncbi:MAG: hydroxymethylbilane synthase [Acidobacteria bacterium]|nr:hydroxymethylbilane synthase [Acidobacteriota bacterium]